MTTLGIIWFILIAVLICGYFALDGFDLGIGVLYPVLAKSEDDRAALRRIIGPVWDGNEVWLLTAGGALFAAFPAAYATSFSGFYLAIMLVLFGLIMRAVSLEFFAHDPEGVRLWSLFFVVGSLLPALLFGVAVGNVVAGIPIDSNGDYTGGFFALLSPFALCCGLLGLSHMLVQGAGWAAFKVPAGSGLRARAASLRRRLSMVELVLFVLVGVLFFAQVLPGASGQLAATPLAVAFAAIAVVCTVLVIVAKPDEQAADLKAMLAQTLGCVALVGMWFSSVFPCLIVSAGKASAITIATAASTDTTLFAMTIIACIGVPLVLIYHVLAYRAFAGRLGERTSSE